MKIILVAPRSITNHKISANERFRFDYAFWNFYMPLMSLGHDVHFFDTSLYGNEELRSKVAEFEPELLFCVMTGSQLYCPQEPWKAIKEQTDKGEIKTFNWFCDDSWRFETFSKIVCKAFTHCSTPEKRFIAKYKDIGYDNIIYAPWCANSELYSTLNCQKTRALSFIGSLRGDRKSYLDRLEKENWSVFSPDDSSFEDMIWAYASSHIGLNFSKNSTGEGTQMKARMFEVPASKAVLLTEYTEDLENCFDIGSEILTFTNEDELMDNIKILKDRDILDSIAQKGHERFLKDHDSKVRLKYVLGEVMG